MQRRLLGLAREAAGPIAATTLVGALAAAAAVAQGLLTAAVVRRFFAPSPAPLAPWLAGLAGLIAVRSALLLGREAAAGRAALAIKLRLRDRLFAHLLALGPGYREAEGGGTVQAVMVDAVEALDGYFAHYLPQLVLAFAVPAVLLGYLATLDPWVAAWVAGCLLLAAAAPRLWDGLLGERGERRWQAYGELYGHFLEGLQGMATLKAFGAGRRWRQGLARQAEEFYGAERAQMSVAMARTGVVTAATAGGTALAIGLAAWRTAAGALPFADLLVLLFLVHECFRPLADLERAWAHGYAGVTAAPLLFRILDARPAVADAAAARPFRPARPPSLELAGVTFHHGRGTAPALSGVSFRIPAGATWGIVGPSGAGKSTLVSLLVRAFDPQAGRITLDGRDLRDFPLADLRQAVAVVSQEVFLFRGTLADNLRLARPEASDEQLERAARAAGIDGFVASLPRGWQTPVGERGLELSGGQRQRLAIARALLKDAPLLVLDEATAHLDGAGETALTDALALLPRGRTTLIVAHRLSTLAGVDGLLVLEDGRLAEAGTPADLLARGGAYARLAGAATVA